MDLAASNRSLAAEASTSSIHLRLMCIQSCFRASNLYAFWSLHRLHCRELFFTHKRRPCAGKAPVAGAAGTDGKQEPPDKFAQTFGTAMPSRIPESTAWWRLQQRELFCAPLCVRCLSFLLYPLGA